MEIRVPVAVGKGNCGENVYSRAGEKKHTLSRGEEMREEEDTGWAEIRQEVKKHKEKKRIEEDLENWGYAGEEENLDNERRSKSQRIGTMILCQGKNTLGMTPLR